MEQNQTKKVVLCNGHKELSPLAKLAYLQLRENTNNIYVYERDDLHDNCVQHARRLSEEEIENHNIGIAFLLYSTEYYGEYIEDVRGYNMIKNEDIGLWNMNREDPNLIKVVECLGDKCSLVYNNKLQSKFAVVEIPEDVEYYIEYRDGNNFGEGMEMIHERHRTWVINQ